MLLKLAVMGNGQIGKVGEGEKGVEREINGSSTTVLHPIVIPCSLTVPLSTPLHSSDRRLQVVNNIAESGLVCEGALSCINKTNFQTTSCSLFCPCEFYLHEGPKCNFLVV